MKNCIQSLIIFCAMITTEAAQRTCIYAQVGETVTLSYSPQREQSQMYLYWFSSTGGDSYIISRNSFGQISKTDGKWNDRLSLTDNSLTIKNLKPEDFQTFTVHLKINREIRFTATYDLNRVNVSAQPSSLLLAGEPLTLSYTKMSQGCNQPNIHWLNPQRIKMVQPISYTLNIKHASAQDSGEWTCVLTHDGKESELKTTVTVVDLSPAPVDPVYVPLSTPSRLRIPCSFPPELTWEHLRSKGIKGGHWNFTPDRSPQPGGSQKLFSLSVDDSLAWTEEQKRGLTGVDLMKNNLSLTKTAVTEEDRGTYTCSLEFPHVILSRSVHVEVLQVLSSSESVLVGHQVNLTCSLGHSLNSELQVKWIPPRSYVSDLRPVPHPATISIRIESEDQDKWRCELLRNGSQLASAQIKLKIEKPPLNIWLYVTICGTIAIFILLLFVTVILVRRHRQRKCRRPKKKFCRCKDPKPKGFYGN